MGVEEQKRAAALRALEDVEPGMRLGLGSGSTAAHFVDVLGAAVAEGLDVLCVPTSEVTATQAHGLGIRLATLEEVPELDLTVDGADELDDQLVLLKGGGGALLREKIVATASHRMTVIADAGKRVKKLGKFPLPVEVVPFGAQVTERQIEEVVQVHGCQGDITVRMNGDTPFMTDGGHLIYDIAFGEIASPEVLGHALNAIPGVVEHGLFVGIATCAIIGTDTVTQVLLTE
jgi:ribose 5-phosphate isomerase A